MPRTVAAPQRHEDPQDHGRARASLRLSDGDGLYLLVQPNGAKWWRFDYMHQGRRKTLSFGTYPEVSLVAARERRAEAREKVAAGIDPSRERQEAREAAVQAMTLRRGRRRVARPAEARAGAYHVREGDLDAQDAGRPVARQTPDPRDRAAGVADGAPTHRGPRQARDGASHQAALRPGVPVCHRDRPRAPRPVRRPPRRADTRTVRAPSRRDGPGAGGKAPERHRRLRRHVRRPFGAATGTAGLRPAWRTPTCRVERDRSRRRRVAHPGGAHEDARGAHRAPEHPGRRDPAGAPAAHGALALRVPVHPHHRRGP